MAAKSKRFRRGSKIWNGNISFGLLNIPVSLQSAQQEKALHFSMIDSKDHAPIKMKRVNANSGKEVPYSRIAKAFKTKEGEMVILDDKDFKAANIEATQAVDIQDFVALDAIDPLLFDKPYYIVPQAGGEKGYFLLRDALEKTKMVAVGKVVIRTKQHLAAIMPRGKYLILELLRFSHEVLEAHEAKYLDGIKEARYSEREMETTEALIEQMAAEWTPDKYKDTYYDDLMTRIRQKLKAGDKEAAPESEEKAEQPKKVVDLLPLLRKSLQKSKKKAS